MKPTSTESWMLPSDGGREKYSADHAVRPLVAASELTDKNVSRLSTRLLPHLGSVVRNSCERAMSGDAHWTRRPRDQPDTGSIFEAPRGAADSSLTGLGKAL